MVVKADVPPALGLLPADAYTAVALLASLGGLGL
jgi:hypothetical protein